MLVRGLLQKVLLLGRAGPTENIIPVRKAAEARDDLMMTARGLDCFRLVWVFRQTGVEA